MLVEHKDEEVDKEIQDRLLILFILKSLLAERDYIINEVEHSQFDNSIDIFLNFFNGLIKTNILQDLD